MLGEEVGAVDVLARVVAYAGREVGNVVWVNILRRAVGRAVADVLNALAARLACLERGRRGGEEPARRASRTVLMVSGILTCIGMCVPSGRGKK